ncbi:hypothetical protein [Ornithinimicrobium kibberense]
MASTPCRGITMKGVPNRIENAAAWKESVMTRAALSISLTNRTGPLT